MIQIRQGREERGGGGREEREVWIRRKEEHSSHCVTGERGTHGGDNSVLGARTESDKIFAATKK